MYHIVKTKSKEQPFQVINVDSGNGKVINTSETLKSKQAAFKNIIANMDTVYSASNECFSVHVQDDTLNLPVAFELRDDGKKSYTVVPGPKYIPGKNPKKKK